MSPIIPYDWGQNADDALVKAQLDSLEQQAYAPRQPVPQPPHLSGLDAATLGILQSMQNMPQARTAGGGFVQGLAQGFAGARARPIQQRQQAYQNQQKSAEQDAEDRRQFRASAARDLAQERWRMYREQNKPTAATKEKQMYTLPDGTKVPMTAGIATGLARKQGAVPSGQSVVSPEDEARLDRVARGMARGDLSPDFGDYGRDTKSRLALADRLMGLGVNQVRLSQKYNAEKTFLRSANGTIALRGMRNVVNARESLDYAEQLLDDSLGKIPRGAVSIFNKAAMDAAANGAFGEEAAGSARQLKAQVAAIRFELSNIYMGGTAPTDQAVKKAMDVIDSNWSEPGLRAAIALARRDLGIRVNAINEVGPLSFDKAGNVKGAPTAATKDTMSTAQKLRKKGIQ